MEAQWRDDEPFLFIPRSDNPDPQNPTNFFMLLDLSATARTADKGDVRNALRYQEATAPYGGLLERLYASITGKERTNATADDILQASRSTTKDPNMRNFAYPDLNMSVVDERGTGFREMFAHFLGVDENNIRNISPQHERHLADFSRHHEAAHNILGLDEAGSDYIAAIHMLRQNDTPETREALQMFQDFRWAAAAGDKKHGVETALAIEAALRFTPEEIQNMSMERHTRIAQRADSMPGALQQIQLAVILIPKERVDMGFGFDDFKTFVSRSWDQVKSGQIPQFQKIYNDIEREDNLDQQRQQFRATASNLLETRSSIIERNTDEAMTRLERFATPAPAPR